MKRFASCVILLFLMISCVSPVSVLYAVSKPNTLASILNDTVPEVQRGCLQFVNEQGEPVPYLYVYLDMQPNYKGYILPTGTSSGPDGTWSPPYAIHDDDPSHITFIVKNLFGKEYLFEKTYELDLPQFQSSPIILVWDKELPLQSLKAYNHKLTIHIQDEKGIPIEGATIQLLKPNFSDQRDFRFTGITDADGNYYTNLHDDTVYTVLIKCSDPQLKSIDREYKLDVTQGGSIYKTFTIKDREKSFIRYF